MNIIEWIIWSIGFLMLISLHPIYLSPLSYFSPFNRSFAVLVAIGLVITAFTEYSKLNLLWWIPLSVILGLIIECIKFTVRANKLEKEFYRKFPEYKE